MKRKLEEEEEKVKEDEVTNGGEEGKEVMEVGVGEAASSSVLSFKPTKSTAEGSWQPVLGLVQMRKLRGNFWKKCGFTVNAVDFLYPEEALSLYERKVLAVFHQDGRLMDKRELFDVSLNFIPLSCYLVYAKLRALDYIVVRHRKSLHLLRGDADLYEYLKQNPGHSLLDSMVSYDLYIDAQNFSKKASKTMAPLSYVVLTDGPVMFSPRVIVKLLEETGAIPVIFAVISSTGHVMLEEITDASSIFHMKPKSSSKSSADIVNSKEEVRKRSEKMTDALQAILDMQVLAIEKTLLAAIEGLHGTNLRQEAVEVTMQTSRLLRSYMMKVHQHLRNSQMRSKSPKHSREHKRFRSFSYPKLSSSGKISTAPFMESEESPRKSVHSFNDPLKSVYRGEDGEPSVKQEVMTKPQYFYDNTDDNDDGDSPSMGEHDYSEYGDDSPAKAFSPALFSAEDGLPISVQTLIEGPELPAVHKSAIAGLVDNQSVDPSVTLSRMSRSKYDRDGKSRSFSLDDFDELYAEAMRADAMGNSKKISAFMSSMQLSSLPEELSSDRYLQSHSNSQSLRQSQEESWTGVRRNDQSQVLGEAFELSP